MAAGYRCVVDTSVVKARKMTRIKLCDFSLLILFLLAQVEIRADDEQLRAFPGADAFGAFTVGGRGGESCM